MKLLKPITFLTVLAILVAVSAPVPVQAQVKIVYLFIVAVPLAGYLSEEIVKLHLPVMRNLQGSAGYPYTNILVQNQN